MEKVRRDVKTWIPRLLQDDAMIPMCESPSYAKACTQYVALKDHEQALAEKDREIQQIREHEFQRGYHEAEEKYEGGCPHDSLGDQACTIEQQAQEIARLREALEGILEIGKRDMTNPKYDVYFEQAQQALKDSQTSK